MAEKIHKDPQEKSTTNLYFQQKIREAFENKTKGMTLFRVVTKEYGLKFRSEPVTREYIHAQILKDEYWVNRFTNIWALEGLDVEGNWQEF